MRNIIFQKPESIYGENLMAQKFIELGGVSRQDEHNRIDAK